MDKYEFNLKMDQMKKLVHEEDYYTALKIVESIDWNRVRNTNLLTMAATVYEKNDRLNEARRILEQALERSPVGKRILFKLTEITVRMGDLKSAEDYYYEYRQVDSEDINIYLLQYLILKARHAPYDRQLQPLELYCGQETDERWLYELAAALEGAGRIDDCIKVCDRLALLFGSSQYTARALRIKMRHTGLTPEQMDILYPKSIGSDRPASGKASAGSAADQGVRGVNPSARTKADSYAEYGFTLEPDPSESAVLRQEPAEEFEDTQSREAEARRNSDALAALRYDNEDEEFEAYIKNAQSAERKTVPVAPAAGLSAYVPDDGYLDADMAEDDIGSVPGGAADEGAPVSDEGTQMAFDFGDGAAAPKIIEDVKPADDDGLMIEEEQTAPGSSASGDSAGQPAVQQAPSLAQVPGSAPAGAGSSAVTGAAIASAVSAGIAAERLASGTGPAAVAVMPEPSQKRTIPSAEIFAGARTAVPVSPLPQAEEAPAADRPETAVPAAENFSMIVEAETLEAGISIAVDELKRIHEEHDIRHASAKTTAAKLNSIGFSEDVIRRIQGRDFVIEGAGKLDSELIEDIYHFIKNDKTGTIVVLVDTPEGMDAIEETQPELFDICDYVSDIEEEEENEGASPGDVPYEDTYEDGFDDEDDLYDEHAYESSRQAPRKRSEGEVRETFSNVRQIAPASDGEEMEIDDFAQYCAQYAAEIDCSITGTSMLALYERIEIMEEDGIALTRENAEKLIEEAADRAEKPPIGKRITGVFHSKYDKNGCLILKESDFIY